MCGDGRRDGEFTVVDGKALRRWTVRRYGDGWREGNWTARDGGVFDMVLCAKSLLSCLSENLHM